MGYHEFKEFFRQYLRQFHFLILIYNEPGELNCVNLQPYFTIKMSVRSAGKSG